MSTKHPSSEICVSHLSALQAFAFCTRCGRTASPTRRRRFPAKTASAAQARRLAASACDKHSPGGLPLPLHCTSAEHLSPRATSFRIPHQCAQTLCGTALLRWDEALLLASPPLAFIQEASSRSFVDTLMLGFELCGTYQQKVVPGTTVYQTTPLSSTRQIRHFLRHNPSLPGAQHVAAALPYLADNAASPRETQAALLLGLPARHGGYGLGIPVMNHEIACSPEAAAISDRRSLRCDLFWPDAKVAAEYQSRAFHAGDRSRIRDSRRANALQSMGITVISITNDELECIEATDVIAQTIRTARGQRFRTKVANYHARKLRLRRQLGLPIWSRETYEPRPANAQRLRTN